LYSDLCDFVLQNARGRRIAHGPNDSPGRY
jgi:hypothetical protein